MPSNVTTYGDISPRTAAHAVVRLLERGQHDLVTERFGQIDPQPKKKSNQRKWRRYNSLARATSPLAEGVPPAGKKLTFTDITATLEQYGDSITITDKIIDTHEDSVLNAAIDVLGEQAAETIEEVRINVLKAGSNVFLANNVASRSLVNSPATRGDFRRIYRSFKRNKAREISQIISPTAKIATEPVASAYFAMGHTDLDSDIRGISGFVPVEKYSNPGAALPAEIGKVEKTRVILTALFEPFETSGLSGSTFLTGGVSGTGQADVYPLIVVARDSYGIVPLQGSEAITPMVVNPRPSVADKLGQIGFVSWKTWQTAAILNTLWLARLEVAATANPS